MVTPIIIRQLKNSRCVIKNLCSKVGAATAVFPVATVVFVFFVSLNHTQSLDNPLPPRLFQPVVLFYPAVFFAAGHGMGTADINRIPELNAYIYGHADSFDVTKIPEDITISPLNTALELTHLYALYAAGWFYRIFGVSVFTLAVYAAFLRAFSAGAIYFVLRLGLSRWGSFAGALVAGASSAMLHMGVTYRDFGRAPFILCLLAVLSALISRSSSLLRLLGLSAVLGLLLGVGVGFRQDLLICIPPVLFTMLFFSPVSVKCPIKARLAAAMITLLVFMIVGWPVLHGTALEGGQATVHPLFHGISPEFEGNLDFGHASYESLIATDPAAFGAISVYARRTGNRDSMVNKNCSEYRRASGDMTAPLLWDPFLYYNGAVYAQFGRLLMKQILLHFPADIVARAWRTVAAFYQMPAEMHRALMDAPADPPAWLWMLIKGQGKLATLMERCGFLFTATALIAVSMFNLHLALYLTGMLAWFAGYPSLWYESRHFFFLVFVPVWSMLACVEWPLRWGYALRDPIQRREWRQTYIQGRGWTTSAARAFSYLIVIIVVIILPVLVMRVWQRGQVQNMARHLAAASLKPHPVTREFQDGQVRFFLATALPGLADAATLPPGETAWEYAAVTLNTHGRDIPVTIQYDDNRLLFSFTQTVTVQGIHDGKEGQVTLFFPVYEVDMSYGGDLMAREILKTYPDVAGLVDDPRPISEQVWWRRGKFQGVTLPAEYESNFVEFSSVGDIDDLPLLFIFQLPEDISQLRTHKTGPWERGLL